MATKQREETNWHVPAALAPWRVEPWENEHTARVRDLWVVRTSQGLVIGPIFGKANARLVAAAPEMRHVIERALLTINMRSNNKLAVANMLNELNKALELADKGARS